MRRVELQVWPVGVGTEPSHPFRCRLLDLLIYWAQPFDSSHVARMFVFEESGGLGTVRALKEGLEGYIHLRPVGCR